MNWDNFADMYSARFRPLGQHDGLSEWSGVVAGFDADRARMALDAISDHHRRLTEDGGRTLGAPRLGEVLAAYKRTETQREWHDFDRDICWHCGDSGWGMGVRGADGRWLDPHRPEPNPRTYLVPIPCTCPHGPKDVPIALRHRLQRHILAPMGTVPGKDDNRCLTFARDWQGVVEGWKPPAAEMAENCAETAQKRKTSPEGVSDHV